MKFFEKGDKPLEIVTTRQWYLRNGGRDADLREELLARGERADVAPGAHEGPLRNWVEGLNGDWLVSRQRFFGVPIPLWYRLDEDGNPDYDAADRARARPSCRSTRPRTRPPGFPRTSAASPAASSATRT